MRRILSGTLLVAIVLLPLGCSRDESVTSPQPVATPGGIDPALVAGQIVQGSGWGFDPAVELPPQVALLGDKNLGGDILDYGYEPLVGDVAHYWWEFAVGSGEHDRVRLHRVVRENRPGKPIRALQNVFLLHGDAVGFVKFLFGAASPNAPDDHAFAIHLANADIDVWGMDQNWVLVPPETSDLGFMNDWGIGNQVENLGYGLAVARAARLFSGNLGQKMPLLGYSSGVMTTCAYLNEESQRPEWQRHVAAYIPADLGYKIDPANTGGIAASCLNAAGAAESLAAGIYEDPTGMAFQAVGYLSSVDPDGDSPVIPGLTNLQSMFFFGGLTFNFYPINDWWHYFGTVVTDGEISDFRFTPLSWAQDFVQTASPYESLRFVYDYSVILCDEEDVPWDDHLGDITVPVLSINPVGGLGVEAAYYLGQLGSTDVTNLDIALLPWEQRAEDYGHIDLWTATDAPSRVWQPVTEWIAAHTERPGGGHRWVSEHH